MEGNVEVDISSTGVDIKVAGSRANGENAAFAVSHELHDFLVVVVGLSEIEQQLDVHYFLLLQHNLLQGFKAGHLSSVLSARTGDQVAQYSFDVLIEGLADSN